MDMKCNILTRTLDLSSIFVSVVVFEQNTRFWKTCISCVIAGLVFWSDGAKVKHETQRRRGTIASRHLWFWLVMTAVILIAVWEGRVKNKAKIPLLPFVPCVLIILCTFFLQVHWKALSCWLGALFVITIARGIKKRRRIQRRDRDTVHFSFNSLLHFYIITKHNPHNCFPS